jgi:hypothetical protein
MLINDEIVSKPQTLLVTCTSVTIGGVWIGFIELLQNITTNKYFALTDLHTF